MTAYRMYGVGPGGRLTLVGAFDAPSDADALLRARPLLNGGAAELWAAGRLVGRFAKDGRFTPVS